MRYNGKQTLETWQIILSAAGLVLSSSVLTVLLNGLLMKRKVKAETNGIGADTGAKVVASASAATDEWQNLYSEQKVQTTGLRAEISDLRKEVIELRKVVETMVQAKLTNEGIVAVAKELARQEAATLTEQVSKLQYEVDKQGKVQAELVRGISILTDQLRQHEIEPKWTLPEWVLERGGSKS